MPNRDEQLRLLKQAIFLATVERDNIDANLRLGGIITNARRKELTESLAHANDYLSRLTAWRDALKEGK